MSCPWSLLSLALAAHALAGCAEPPALATQASFHLRPWQGRDRDESFRLAPPRPGPDVDLLPQTVEEAQLPTGLRILLVARHDFPIVDMAIVVRRGASDAAPGVAHMAAGMLAAKNSGWRITLGPESLVISASMTPARVTTTFSRGASLVQRPEFSEHAFAVERTRRVSELSATSPSGHINLMTIIGGLLYPEGHPYRLPVDGGDVSFKNVTLKQLVEFARGQMAPDQTTVVAVGDITMVQLTEVVSEAFANWQEHASVRARLPRSVDRLPKAPAITLVNQPTLTQSTIVVAALGGSVLDGDFEALQLLDQILCAAPTTSRINLMLREKLGYTYQAMSHVEARRGQGPILFEQAVAKESTDASLREILRQIARLRSEDVPEQELAAAKARLRSSVLLDYDSFSTTFEAVTKIAELGLSPRYAASRLARIRAISAKQLRTIAAEYLAPERLRVVIVGDARTIKAPLEAMDLGSVEVIASKNRAP
jgi:zinc protease